MHLREIHNRNSVVVKIMDSVATGCRLNLVLLPTPETLGRSLDLSFLVPLAINRNRNSDYL